MERREPLLCFFCPYHPSVLPPHSLKREIKKLAQDECGYEEPTVAMAFVYFEKLVLQGKLNKQNRKLCAGACVLLAAKIGGDLKKHEVKLLIDVSSPHRFRVSPQSDQHTLPGRIRRVKYKSSKNIHPRVCVGVCVCARRNLYLI